MGLLAVPLGASTGEGLASVDLAYILVPAVGAHIFNVLRFFVCHDEFLLSVFICELSFISLWIPDKQPIVVAGQLKVQYPAAQVLGIGF